MSSPRSKANPFHDPELAQGQDEFLFPGLGEFLRRFALGATALLIVTRAYFPSEDADTGSGLVWVLLILMTSGFAVVANLVSGVTRVRWSWVDAAVVALILLVAFSAGHGADRRAAITMAWEWGGLGLLYLLVRNLPRTRAESVALTLILIATAVAVATYGLYQAGVEFPLIRRQFERNPDQVLLQLGIEPKTPEAISFAHRLLDSNEPFSTFALANSLAGFIVGPLVILIAIGLENLKRDGDGRRWWGLTLASVPSLALLICLLLTKSRSAWVGGIAAGLVLAWWYRSVVPRRWLVGMAVGFSLVLAGLVGLGLATGKLDRQVLTEAPKSLGYRLEYWRATWGIITDAVPAFAPTAAATSLPGSGLDEPTSRSARPFWWGLGPGNFAGPYLRHKLPEASETIKDPHNAVLEVWADAGIFATLAFLSSLGLGVYQILIPDRRIQSKEPLPAEPKLDRHEPGLPPTSSVWLLVTGGLGWFGVWMIGQLDPIRQPDMTYRWLILGVAWLASVLLIRPISTRRSIPAAGLGAAVVAMAVELQAAGGIGIPSVAMILWVLLALGLNLHEDRSGSRLRIVGGMGAGVLLACGWAILAGTFYGAVLPAWRSEATTNLGEAALASKPPRFEEAEAAFRTAIDQDRYAVRPWLALADTEYQFWRSPEASNQRKTAWTRVLLTLDKALEENYRNPDNLTIRRRQLGYARLILSQLPDDAQPMEYLGLKSTIAKAARQSVRLYPTSAPFRIELADASAQLGLYPDAIAEARVAIQLDDLMPHKERNLTPRQRSDLQQQIVGWQEQAKAPVPTSLGR